MKSIVVKTGEYQKDGETKATYTTIGKVITKQDGTEFLKIDAIPLNWDGYANLYQRDENRTV